ncbi:hypothetical protein GQ457_06G008320 [Hibiscus cannabinus]
MELAWGLGYRQLIIESDCADALRWIEHRHSNGRPFTIIHSIHLLCDLEWCLVFSKVARSLNGVADSLAKFNLNDEFDVVFYEEPPIGLALD